MTDFFKPNDFNIIWPGLKNDHPTFKEVADRANELLEKALGHVVFGSAKGHSWTPSYFNGDTQTAVLFNIQPIEKRCETHIPHNPNVAYPKCLGCGKVLKAEWREVCPQPSA